MSETHAEADVTVDAIGSSCPGPMMELIGRMKTADPGTVVRLQSSNADTEPDVAEWADQSGHELLEVVEREDHWDLYVEKHE